MPKRTRTAGAGLTRYAVPALAAARIAAACRSGVTSSRIQKPRPCVPATRSEHRQRAVVLHLQVAHRDRRHVEPQRLPVIAVVERHPDLRVGRGVEQSLLPRIFADRVGRRAGRDAGVDLRPGLAAVVRAPEVRIEVVDAHGVRRRVRGQRVEVAGLDVEDARPRLDRGGVTFVHFAPPSIVTWMWPSSVPAQSTFTSLGDGERAVMAPGGRRRHGARVLARRSPARPRSAA